MSFMAKSLASLAVSYVTSPSSGSFSGKLRFDPRLGDELVVGMDGDGKTRGNRYAGFYHLPQIGVLLTHQGVIVAVHLLIPDGQSLFLSVMLCLPDLSWWALTRRAPAVSACLDPKD